MKFVFLIITLVPAVLSASIGTNERKTLLVMYTVDCMTKSGVSYSALAQPSSSNVDPAYNDFLSCLLEKYFSADSRAMNFIQNVNLPVITSYSQKCALHSKISMNTLIQIADENPPEDDTAYKKYLSCYLVKMGILTVDGDIGDDTTKVEKWLLTGSAQKVLDSIKTNCGDKKGATLQDTAVLISKCMK